MRRKLRIGLLATEMCSPGGVQSFMWRVTEVLGGLVAEGTAEAFCVSLNDTTEALGRHIAMPARVDAWGAGRSKLRFITYALTRIPAPDILIVGHIGPAPVAHLLHKLGRARRYWVILHGIEAWQRVPFLKRQAMQAATGVVATTRYTAEEFGRHNGIPAGRFHVIPLCADERAVTSGQCLRLRGGFRLLCVARQASSERYKGVEHILQALARLAGDHSDVHLNLVGDGDDQARLMRIAQELGVSERVTFWGVLSDAELAAAYAQCDVFVMPSKKEGFGIVFLEAMRHGKPCIGGNHGGTPEVIEHGDSGFLVEYGDVEALERYVRELRGNPELRSEMGQRGWQLTRGRFSQRSFRRACRELIQDHAHCYD